jgi:IS1 family transposase
MNYLPEAKQIQIIRCLTEGMAVRTTARVVGVSKGAVLRIIKRVGPAGERFHHRFVHDVPCKRVELDELHEFVFGKSRCLSPERRANPNYGSVWTWLGITESKLILSYRVGARDLATCDSFVGDVAYRVRGKVQISTDAYSSYIATVPRHFHHTLLDYGTIEKEFETTADPKRPEARYAPAKIRRIFKRVVCGDPDASFMTTSHVEKFNQTLRMTCKRYARLTNAHSKEIRFHRWALAMQVFAYNWMRPHMALDGKTPAQASGLTEYRFTAKDMLRLAMWADEDSPTRIGA